MEEPPPSYSEIVDIPPPYILPSSYPAAYPGRQSINQNTQYSNGGFSNHREPSTLSNATTSTTVTIQPTSSISAQQPAVAKTSFGKHSIETLCPYCGEYITTYIQYEVGDLNWLVCFILCYLQ